MKRFGDDIKRSAPELPGEVPIALFNDRIKREHQVSQLGFVLVKVPKNTEPFNVKKGREVMRKCDTFCISQPGSIVILIARIPNIKAVEAVVKKIKDHLNDSNIKVVGVFVPYPELELSDVEYTLENFAENLGSRDISTAIYDHNVCQTCNVTNCLLRDELKFTTCLGTGESTFATRRSIGKDVDQDDVEEDN